MLPLLFFIHSASAVTYNLTFCGRYDVAYDDASGSFHDDYVTSSGTYPARGARITVTRNSDGAVMRDAYTSDSGSTPGCLTSTVALDSTQTYNLKIWSRASVSGNTVYVYNDDTSFGISGYGRPGTPPHRREPTPSRRRRTESGTSPTRPGTPFGVGTRG